MDHQEKSNYEYLVEKLMEQENPQTHSEWLDDQLKKIIQENEERDSRNLEQQE